MSHMDPFANIIAPLPFSEGILKVLFSRTCIIAYDPESLVAFVQDIIVVCSSICLGAALIKYLRHCRVSFR